MRSVCGNFTPRRASSSRNSNSGYGRTVRRRSTGRTQDFGGGSRRFPLSPSRKLLTPVSRANSRRSRRHSPVGAPGVERLSGERTRRAEDRQGFNPGVYRLAGQHRKVPGGMHRTDPWSETTRWRTLCRVQGLYRKSGDRPLSSPRFRQALLEKGVQSVTVRGNTVWLGVKVKFAGSSYASVVSAGLED